MKILVENSLKEKRLTEAIDQENYEKLISKIIEDKMKNSLAYKICEIQPLTSPVGVVLSSKFTNKLVVSKTKVEAETHKVKTEITQEALDDLTAISGGYDILTNFLRKASDKEENQSFIDFLDANAVVSSNIQYDATAKPNAETRLFYLIEKIGDIAATINKDSYKTYTSFCILPYKLAGSILAMSYTSNFDDEDLNLGTYKKIKFFLNPDVTKDWVYVGLTQPDDPGSSSVIFSPYQYFAAKGTDSENGKEIVNVFNRYKITMNPLDTQMVHKFKVL